MGVVSSSQAHPAKSNTYTPAVERFAFDDTTNGKKKSVLVIGSGCAGLAAAWHLNRCGIDVKVFEKSDKLGGHANTINGESFLSCFTSKQKIIIPFLYDN